MNWIKTTDALPSPEKDTPYLVWYKEEITILWWNVHYQSWDTFDGDDYECDALTVSYWMELPEKPE